jgi:phosphoglycerate-specific signal transduction histidine kinase
MAENHKLVDSLTEQWQHKITEVTEVICHLKEETRLEIQPIRDYLNKLSASVYERVSRHINSTIDQHNSWHKDINTELNLAKKYIYASCKLK